MSTAELKIDLINIIANMKDTAKLKELMELVSFQKDETVYLTSEDDKNAISEAMSHIDKSEVLTNESVVEEINEWLEK